MSTGPPSGGPFYFVNISIDYDDTYTKNPEMWDKIIETMQAHGCNVFCITKRWEKESADISISVPVIHAVKSKMEAAARSGISIDVWIDDRPHTITPYALINKGRSSKR
jgi:hypothetical protein